ncbi:tetratricopeptide repeat protein 39C-like isoform X1 [Acyrthosiphon pisum]|uniref:Tetratricopeptide repeat protein 39C n=1 Tax=Acyrthosiphon pisum TaxID=7029 RepID=A0A8R2JQK7_ACYPI|nr:tetratricopeptide repeat protein 39C-like isoform X1 [Acyrthosiphon pisum]XP_016660182.1 tetratricopeptide repeat protein 39C-like isoform X1 [Acyrthosiphon pisum]XP_029344007.1 tetratricopeptide repeat protein 39C-like isoform X1 [Acyrthosiphon pisum]|eukprot:XP_001950347.2 PREDICTED: tetratricopeptide repeat protein 39C-like isoform X1 [Acyrthosiphon pisum]
MSSDNEPTWRICRKAVWMLIQNVNNLADAEALLNRQENDLHIASGKCFILLLTAIQTPEKSRLECALAEFKRLEARCGAMLDDGGWLGAFRRKLQFSSSAAAGVDYYDGQIALADVTLCIVGLMVVKVINGYNVGHMATAKTIYTLRRAWKMYQQCYASVLDIYRTVYDLDPDDNTPRWPPVLKRRQSTSATSLASTSNVESRMHRSATTSFVTLRQDCVSNGMTKDVVRLMAAVSVGYGAFNLILSLMSPMVIPLIGMLGFRGNRQTGLEALAFAKNGPDVHAPLAWLILSWYHMMGNTDYLFDGPQSRENETYIKESEQLVCNPPEEFQNSTSLQYFTGRSLYLKGDLERSIRAYEIGSTVVVDNSFVSMKTMCLHELGFMYAIRLDWMAAYKKFASVAEVWMRQYHYFMATVCAGAAGDSTTAELMRQRADEAVSGCRLNACPGTMCSFMESKERKVAEALRWTAAASSGDDADCNRRDGQRHCRLIAYEVLYVKYGVAKWPVDSLHAVLSDCQEAEDDDNTMWYTKQLLTIVCRRVLGFVDDHCHSLIEIVENMDRNQRRDHLYVYGVYELTAEQIRHIETIDEGKRTVQKLKDIKRGYHFQYFYDMRCVSLQAYVQKLNAR